MSNTKTEIDFEKIIDNAYNNGIAYTFNEIHIHLMKSAIKQARNIILQEAAEKVKKDYGDAGMTGTGKKMYDLVLSLTNSEELNKKLGI